MQVLCMGSSAHFAYPRHCSIREDMIRVPPSSIFMTKFIALRDTVTSWSDLDALSLTLLQGSLPSLPTTSRWLNAS
jgi:hypothetical protein